MTGERNASLRQPPRRRFARLLQAIGYRQPVGKPGPAEDAAQSDPLLRRPPALADTHVPHSKRQTTKGLRGQRVTCGPDGHSGKLGGDNLK